jgi:cytochrome c553
MDSALALRGQIPENGGGPPATSAPPVLAWDADLKEEHTAAGATNVVFTFWVTNVSPADAAIFDVKTSCGCTAAQLPSQPWILNPAASGPIRVTLDVRGHHGVLMKGLTVNSSAGTKELAVRATVPMPTNANPALSVAAGREAMGLRGPSGTTLMSNDRLRNLQVALGDRQAVFRDDCARCHAEPARGKSGHDLYVAVCGVCHDATLRATLIPDLKKSRRPRTRDYLRQMIADGRPGSLMPAFAADQGGPLTEPQIASLVAYLETNLPQGTNLLSDATGQTGPPVATARGPASLPDPRLQP